MLAKLPPKLLFVVNVDWFFISHRLPIAMQAIEQGYEVHIATAITDKLETLQSAGLIVHPLSISRSGSGAADLWSTCRALWTIYRQVKPDIVHLVTIKPVLLGGLVARLAKVPAVVAAVPGLGFIFSNAGRLAAGRKWLITQFYGLVFRHPRIKIIFQNQDDLALLSASAPGLSSKVTIIPGSGVDIGLFQPSPLPGGVPLVVLAARMLADKGVREFVQAAQLLQGQGVQARFCLVGTPDPSNPASLNQHELESWQQRGWVELWGHRTDMPAVLSSATLVVLPSYREGLPKVLIEAAACGRAVITTDVPGCRDAILPGQTGLLVPVRDATALAKAIAELIHNPQRCAAMGLAGRQLAESTFDVKSVVQRHLTIYQELLANAQAKVQAKAQEVET